MVFPYLSSPTFTILATGLCLFLYVLVGAIWNRILHPLSRFPGPFWASITTLWYFRSVRYGIGENHQLPLHVKYGPIVRIGPNMLAISDANALDAVYGPHGDKTFTKTEFYDGLASHISKTRDVFSERDESKAVERRRAVAHIYSQASIRDHEPGMDKVIGHLESRLLGFARTGEVFDISVWFHKFGFDVMGDLFFGREGGFGNVRDNVDHNRWCRSMETMPNVGGATTYMPALLRPVWIALEVLLGGKEARDGVRGLNKVIQDARRATREKSEAMQSKEHIAQGGQDMLSRLIDLTHTRGADLNFGLLDVATDVWASIWAGGDTTGTTLTAVFYYLHKHPERLTRLVSELDLAHANGTLPSPVRYKDAVKLPYLAAVMQETMRLHPVIGIGLPRRVPDPGASLCGEWIPGGMTVVMNPNVIHRDKSIFGEDAESFRPERWLADDKQAATMSRHMFAYGYGRRVCLGKHIANTEMYKVVPAVLLRFSLKLARPDMEWTVNRGFFQGQKNVQMQVSCRQVVDHIS